MRTKNIFNIIVFLLALVSGFYTAHQSLAAGREPFIVIRDSEIESIIREWAAPIFKAANLEPDNVKIILVQSDKMNAFVAGGSNIFLYTGLIESTDNPGELLGVIAHETGHITGGHLIATRTALERASYESMIGMILGIGAAIASNDASAVSAIAVGGTSLAQRGFFAHSRVQESSADQAALTFMEKSNLNPTGLMTFMKKLESQQYAPVDQQSEYVRTHPLVDNRIDALKHRVSESSYKNSAYPAGWTDQHARIRAKLMGFIRPGQIAWHYDDKDKSIPALYARTIANYRENKTQDAVSGIENLLSKEPSNPYFWELKGQMLVDFGKVAEGVTAYNKALQYRPNDPLLRVAYAHALIESAYDGNEERLNEAINNLEKALKSEHRNSRIHRLLATAYGRLKQENQAKLHLAEEAVLQRNFDYAEQHAKAIIASEEEGSPLWIRAKDVITFIEIEKKG